MYFLYKYEYATLKPVEVILRREWGREGEQTRCKYEHALRYQD
jgi:hypothetical protein